jgi:hypothetical protein
MSLPIKLSARSVRKNALQHGLVEPREPLFIQHTLDDGSTTRVWQPRNQGFSSITDADLDVVVFDILQSFPNYGRAMVSAELLRRGHRVQRHRARAAYVRVHGAPRVWGQRNIPRRPYSVAGPNSLWHHDGQHGTQACTSSYITLIHFVQGLYDTRSSYMVSLMGSLGPSLACGLAITTEPRQ